MINAAAVATFCVVRGKLGVNFCIAKAGRPRFRLQFCARLRQRAWASARAQHPADQGPTAS